MESSPQARVKKQSWRTPPQFEVELDGFNCSKTLVSRLVQQVKVGGKRIRMATEAREGSRQRDEDRTEARPFVSCVTERNDRLHHQLGPHHPSTPLLLLSSPSRTPLSYLQNTQNPNKIICFLDLKLKKLGYEFVETNLRIGKMMGRGL